MLGCRLRLLRQATIPLDSRQLRFRVSPGDGTLRFAGMDESAKAAGQSVARFCWFVTINAAVFTNSSSTWRKVGISENGRPAGKSCLNLRRARLSNQRAAIRAGVQSVLATCNDGILLSLCVRVQFGR